MQLAVGNPNGAVISPCGRYRYLLWRQFGPGPVLTMLFLNPSIANATDDDATITRCVRRARLLGFGGIRVCNIFALISTDRDQLLRVDDPVGPENDAYILDACRDAGSVLCGWGEYGSIQGRAEQVVARLRAEGIALHCLHRNRDGSPRHPLYVGYNKPLIAFG